MSSSAVKEALVFDFGRASTRLVHVRVDGGTAKIQNALLVANSGTEQDRLVVYRAALSSFGLRGRVPAVLVLEEGVEFRQVSVPSMPPDDLKKALAWELREKHGLDEARAASAASHVLDVELGDGTIEKLHDVFFTDRASLASKIGLVRSLGFEPFAAIPSAVALAEWVSRYSETGRDTLVFDIGRESARIYVVRGREILFTRTVPLGGQVLTDLMSSGQIEGRRLEPAAAEELKISHGVSDPQAAHVHLVRPYLDKVVAEIKRSIDYFENQRYAAPIARVCFTGPGAGLKGMDAFMGRFLSFERVRVDAESLLDSASLPQAAKTVRENPAAFAAAAGAVAADPRWNLIPETLKQTRARSARGTGVRIAMASGIGALVFFVAWSLLSIQTLRAERAAIQRQGGEIGRVTQLLNELETQQRFMRLALRGSFSFPALFKQLSLVTPRVVTIEEITYDRPTGTCVIRGLVHSSQQGDLKVLAQFINELIASPFFEEATLASSLKELDAERYKFEIRCTPRGLQ